MTPEQRERLSLLSERLVDLVLDEADPENWSGGLAKLKDLSRLERGDRLWCKKNAAASLGLALKVEAILVAPPPGAPLVPGGGDGDSATERAIERAERAAQALLDKVGARGPART